MLIYFIPLVLLSIFSLLENIDKFRILLKNKYLYFCVFCLFVIFICFRDQIGCDWDNYINHFKKISENDIDFIFKNQKEFLDLGYIFIAKLVSYKFEFHILIFIYGIFFTIPLFIFCYLIKRTYLSLLISYPYFIIVVGMGPIRQASSIAFLLSSILLFIHKKNVLGYFFSIFSILFHQSSIIFNALILFLNNKSSKRKIDSFIKISFYSIILVIFLNNFPLIYEKIINYFKDVNSNARGVIFVWILNLIPSLLYLYFQDKFIVGIFQKKLLKISSLLVILIMPIMFIKSTIAYRLLLFLFPSTIYIASSLPEIKFFGEKSILFTYLTVIFSFLSLVFWLKFAHHSYCWIPYQNILF